jgi:hypothetical protein
LSLPPGTPCICIGEEKESLKFDSGEEIKPRTECTYLGTKTDQTGDNTTEIKQNYSNKKSYRCFKFYLVAQRYYKNRKLYIYQTIIQSNLKYGAEVWQIPTREINKILSTEMDVLRRSARKSRIERIKNVYIKEIIGVKEKPDIIDIIERKRPQWYGHVKRMQDERLLKLIMEWIPGERRKRGRPRKTRMEGVRAAMKTRYLEADQWLKRKERCLGSGRRRQLSQDRKDR